MDFASFAATADGTAPPPPPTISSDLSIVSPSLLKAHMQRDLGRFLHSSRGTNALPPAVAASLALSATAATSANHQAILAAVSSAAPTAAGASGGSSSSSASAFAASALSANVTNTINNPNANFYGLLGLSGAVPPSAGGHSSSSSGSGGAAGGSAGGGGAPHKATPAAIAAVGTYAAAHDILSNHSILGYKLSFPSAQHTELFRKVCGFLATGNASDTFEAAPVPPTAETAAAGVGKAIDGTNNSNDTAAAGNNGSSKPTSPTGTAAPASALAAYKARAASLINHNNASAIAANARKDALAALPSAGKIVLRRTETIADPSSEAIKVAPSSSASDKKKKKKSEEGLVDSPPLSPRNNSDNGDERAGGASSSPITSPTTTTAGGRPLSPPPPSSFGGTAATSAAEFEGLMAEAADRLLAFLIVSTPALASTIDNGSGFGANPSGNGHPLATTSADLTPSPAPTSTAQLLAALSAAPPIVRLCRCYPQLFARLREKVQWAFYQQLLRDAAANANANAAAAAAAQQLQQQMLTPATPASHNPRLASASATAAAAAGSPTHSVTKRVSSAASPVVATSPSFTRGMSTSGGNASTSSVSPPISAGPAAGASVALLPASAWLSLWLDLHHTAAALGITPSSASPSASASEGTSSSEKKEGKEEKELSAEGAPSPFPAQLAQWTPLHRARIAVREIGNDSTLRYAPPGSASATGPLVPSTAAPLLAAHIPMEAISAPTRAAAAADEDDASVAVFDDPFEAKFRAKLAKIYRDVVPQIQLLAAASALPSPLSGSAVARAMLTDGAHISGSSTFMREVVLAADADHSVSVDAANANPSSDDTIDQKKNAGEEGGAFAPLHQQTAASVAASLSDAEKVRLFFGQLYTDGDDNDGEETYDSPAQAQAPSSAGDGAKPRPTTNAALADFLLFTSLISPVLTHRKADVCRGHGALKPLATVERVEKGALWHQLSLVTDALFNVGGGDDADTATHDEVTGAAGGGGRGEFSPPAFRSIHSNGNLRAPAAGSASSETAPMPMAGGSFSHGGSRLLSRLSTLNAAGDDDASFVNGGSSSFALRSNASLVRSPLPNFIQEAPSTLIGKLRLKAAAMAEERAAEKEAKRSKSKSKKDEADDDSDDGSGGGSGADSDGDVVEGNTEESPASPLAATTVPTTGAKRTNASNFSPGSALEVTSPRHQQQPSSTAASSAALPPLANASAIVPAKFHEHFSIDNALMTCLWGLEELVAVNVLQNATYDMKTVVKPPATTTTTTSRTAANANASEEKRPAAVGGGENSYASPPALRSAGDSGDLVDGSAAGRAASVRFDPQANTTVLIPSSSAAADGEEEETDEMASPDASPHRGASMAATAGSRAHGEKSIAPNSALASQAASPERVHIAQQQQPHRGDDEEEAEDGDLEAPVITAANDADVPTVDPCSSASPCLADHSSDDGDAEESAHDAPLDDDDGNAAEEEEDNVVGGDEGEGQQSARDAVCASPNAHDPNVALLTSRTPSSSALLAPAPLSITSDSDPHHQNQNQKDRQQQNATLSHSAVASASSSAPSQVIVVPPSYPSLAFPAKTPASVSSLYANVMMSVTMLCSSRTRSHPLLDALAFTRRTMMMGDGGGAAETKNKNMMIAMNGAGGAFLSEQQQHQKVLRFASSSALSAAVRCLASSVVNLRALTISHNHNTARQEHLHSAIEGGADSMVFIDGLGGNHHSAHSSSSSPASAAAPLLLTSPQQRNVSISATYGSSATAATSSAGGGLTLVPHNPLRDTNTLLALHDLLATAAGNNGEGINDKGDRPSHYIAGSAASSVNAYSPTSPQAPSPSTTGGSQRAPSLFTMVVTPRSLPSTNMTLPLSYATTQTLLQWQFQSFVQHPTPITAAALLHVLAREGEAVMNVMVNGTTLLNSPDAFNTNGQNIAGGNGAAGSNVASKRPNGYGSAMFGGGGGAGGGPDGSVSGSSGSGSGGGSGSSGGGTSSSSPTAGGGISASGTTGGPASQQIPIGDAIIIAACRTLQTAITVHTAHAASRGGAGNINASSSTTANANDLLYAPPGSWPLYCQLALAAVRLVAARNAYIRHPHWATSARGGGGGGGGSAATTDSQRKRGTANQPSSAASAANVTPVPHVTLSGPLVGPAGMHRDAQKALGLVLLTVMRLYVNERDDAVPNTSSSSSCADTHSAAAATAESEASPTTASACLSFDAKRRFAEKEGFSSVGAMLKALCSVSTAAAAGGLSSAGGEDDDDANERDGARNLFSIGDAGDDGEEEGAGDNASFAPFANDTFFAGSLSSAHKLLAGGSNNNNNSAAIPASSSYRLRRLQHERRMAAAKAERDGEKADATSSSSPPPPRHTNMSLRGALNRYRHRTPTASALRVLLRAAEEALRDGTNPQQVETITVGDGEEASLLSAAEARTPSNLDGSATAQRYNFNNNQTSSSSAGGDGGGNGPEPRRRGFGEAAMPNGIKAPGAVSGAKPAECPEVLRRTLVAAIRLGPMLVIDNTSATSMNPTPASSPSSQRAGRGGGGEQQQQQPFAEEVNLFRLIEQKDGGAFVNADIIETLEAAATYGQQQQQAGAEETFVASPRQSVNFSTAGGDGVANAANSGSQRYIPKYVDPSSPTAHSSSLPTEEKKATDGEEVKPKPSAADSATAADKDEDKDEKGVAKNDAAAIIESHSSSSIVNPHAGSIGVLLFPPNFTNVRKTHLNTVLAATPTLGPSLFKVLPCSDATVPLFDPRDEPTSFRDNTNPYGVGCSGGECEFTNTPPTLTRAASLAMGGGRTSTAVTNYFSHILRCEQQRGGGRAGGLSAAVANASSSLFDFDDEEDTANRLHISSEFEGRAASYSAKHPAPAIAPRPLLPASSLAALVASSRGLGGGNASASARVPSHYSVAMAERSYGELRASIDNLTHRALAPAYGMPPAHTAWAVCLTVAALKRQAAVVNGGGGGGEGGRRGQTSVVTHTMRHYGEFITHL